MRAAQIAMAGGAFELVSRPIPEPSATQCLIKVEACGVCHSDVVVKEAVWPGLELPRVPGHEVIGRVVKMGAAVPADAPFSVGSRVGLGWHGGHCFGCDSCRRGDFNMCANEKVTGISHDGGYAEYVVSGWEAMARVPDDIPSAEAAPLLCAGITVYNSLRNSGARAGDTAVVLGLGGLGHLAIQYANKMGFRVVALSTSDDKKELAIKLGAHVFINSKQQDAAAEINKLGGAHVVVATAPSGELMGRMQNCMAVNCKILVLALGDNVSLSPVSIIGKRASAVGWPSGTAIDSEDTLRFSVLTGVRPMVQEFTLDQVNEAYDAMINNKARFRAVLVMQ
jgi:alcohol dehydrogenase/propanol-preferring alcohol dehydrogenase